MKKAFLSALAVFIIMTLAGQTPKKFNYQGAVRDASNHLIVNTAVELEISIIQGSETGSVVFTEMHNVTTSEIGLVAVQIGSNEPADFGLIDWSDGPYFLQVTADGAALPATQLLSVPYAEYADQAGNVPDPQQISISNDTVRLSDGGEIVLPDSSATNELQVLSFNQDTIFLIHEASEDTSFVELPQGDYTQLLNLPDMDYYRTIVAYDGGELSMDLSSTEVVMKSVTISVPVSGIIEVDAVGYIRFQGTGLDYFRASITTTTYHDYSYLMIASDYNSANTGDEDLHSFAASRTYVVNSGTYTFNLLGDTFLASCVTNVGDINMKAVFHPDPPSAKKAVVPSIEDQEMSPEESERRSKLGIAGE